MDVERHEQTLEAVGERWRAARRAERTAMAALTGAIIAAAAEHRPERQIVRDTGVSRDTVRRSLGKAKPRRKPIER
jgi:hypothetical protein